MAMVAIKCPRAQHENAEKKIRLEIAASIRPNKQSVQIAFSVSSAYVSPMLVIVVVIFPPYEMFLGSFK
jgi:hypothetical protein